MTMNDIGKRSHVLKHSHGRFVVVAFDKNLHEGSIWTVPIAVISCSFHKPICPHFLHHGTKFYDKYVKSDDRKKYIDDDGSGIFPKQKVENIYNEKYQTTYYNQNYVLDRY